MRAGFGTASITPAPPVYLAGFGGRTEPAQRVHDDLEARTLFLSDGGESLTLVVCDLLGMSPGYSFPVREAIAGELGVGIDRVLVACTHTHQGPSAMAGTEALGWPNPEGLTQLLVSGCLAATKAARDAAATATLRFGSAPLPDGLSFNRRGGAYEEPVFRVLDVEGEDGRIGVVANLSIHPVLLGPHWDAVSTDWVGPFRNKLEELAGGAAIQLTGSLGDINPTPPHGRPGDTYEPWASAEETTYYGEKLAGIVNDALADAKEIGSELGVMRADTLDLPVGGTAIAALLGEPTMRTDLIEWQIGDVRLVSIPGEAFHLLGREIAAARGGRVLLAGISPSWCGYLPHPWGEGYEEGVSYGEDYVAAVRNELIKRPS